MSSVKIFTIAGALLIGASSLAMAQANGSVAHNAAATGGTGYHHDSLKTGSAASNQKWEQNQNGYRY